MCLAALKTVESHIPSAGTVPVGQPREIGERVGGIFLWANHATTTTASHACRSGLMARIRSIKPEFPQSESMGNVSRDARLTFIQLWTIADDEGRLRGNSRMLASLLYPYDDDAKRLIDKWLLELESQSCITRY